MHGIALIGLDMCNSIPNIDIKITVLHIMIIIQISSKDAKYILILLTGS